VIEMVCVHQLTEEQVNNLGNSKKEQKIKEMFAANIPYILDKLRKNEKCAFCMWNYIVIGSFCLCADIEELDNE